jgi:hypothetical protein
MTIRAFLYHIRGIIHGDEEMKMGITLTKPWENPKPLLAKLARGF